MNYFLGVLTVGVSLALLAKEWALLLAHRAGPDELLPYDERTFRRRAMVSILLMFFVAVYSNQELAMRALPNLLAKAGYLSIHPLIVVIIYIEVLIDFRHGRRVAHQMTRILIEQQGDYVQALGKLGRLIDAIEADPDGELRGGEPSVLDARADPPPPTDPAGKA